MIFVTFPLCVSPLEFDGQDVYYVQLGDPLQLFGFHKNYKCTYSCTQAGPISRRSFCDPYDHMEMVRPINARLFSIYQSLN